MREIQSNFCVPFSSKYLLFAKAIVESCVRIQKRLIPAHSSKALLIVFLLPPRVRLHIPYTQERHLNRVEDKIRRRMVGQSDPAGSAVQRHEEHDKEECLGCSLGLKESSARSPNGSIPSLAKTLTEGCFRRRRRNSLELPAAPCDAISQQRPNTRPSRMRQRKEPARHWDRVGRRALQEIRSRITAHYHIQRNAR